MIIHSHERLYIHRKIIGRINELSIEKAMEIIVCLWNQIDRVLEHTIGLYGLDHHYIVQGNVYFLDNPNDWKFPGLDAPTKKNLYDGIAQILNSPADLVDVLVLL